jgi:hypothetical protein
MMKVDVVSNYYIFAHGRSPYGVGTWAFGPKPNTPCNEVFWAPSCLTYTQAKVHAIAWARAAGHSVVYVQS